MKCFNCGSFLYEGDTCNVCGADVSMFKKIVKESNALYNKGLEYAKDRNMSRAVQCLEVALKMYKNNVNARNLLGLVYYETGEYTLALAQWVLSKNIQPENNLANEFIDNFQDKRSELDRINSALKKYNKAVSYAHQGSYDLAEIQLKKLLNDTPNIVKGHQLLALLLIRKNKLADAKVALRKAEKIDAGNPMTISLQTAVMDEIKEEEKDLSPGEIKAKRSAEAPEEERAPLSGDDVIIPESNYKERNPIAMAILQTIIGVIIGAAIVFFIVTPAKTKSARAELASVKTDYENQISTLNARIAELEGRKETSDEKSVTEIDNYKNLIEALNYFANEDYTKGLAAAEKIDIDKVEDADFKSLYENSIAARMATLGDDLYDQGIYAYESGNYETAADAFYRSYEYNKEQNDDSLFLAASSYWALGNDARARELFELYTTEFPEGYRIDEAYYNLEQIPANASGTTTEDNAEEAPAEEYVEEAPAEEAPAEEY